MEIKSTAKTMPVFTALKGAAAADLLAALLTAAETALISSGAVKLDAQGWISSILLALCSIVSGFFTAGKVPKAKLPWAVLSGVLLAIILLVAGAVFFPDFALGRCLSVFIPALAGSAAGGVLAGARKGKKA